jgi:hypothetical protein
MLKLDLSERTSHDYIIEKPAAGFNIVNFNQKHFHRCSVEDPKTFKNVRPIYSKIIHDGQDTPVSDLPNPGSVKHSDSHKIHRHSCDRFDFQFRSPDLFPLYWNFIHLHSEPLPNYEHLRIKTPPLDVLVWEDAANCLSREEFETTLRIFYSTNTTEQRQNVKSKAEKLPNRCSLCLGSPIEMSTTANYNDFICGALSLQVFCFESGKFTRLGRPIGIRE